MITRRAFIKTLGVASVGVAAGITAKNIFSHSTESFHLYGFIPNDNDIIRSLSLYIKEITGYRDVILQGDYRNILANYFNLKSESALKINIKIIHHNCYSDIMRGDTFKSVYSLSGFDPKLLKIRESISGKKADLFFSAELQNKSLLDIYNTKKKFIIENHKGIYDEIDFNKAYKLIDIPGLHGMTSVEIKNGLLNIIKASCRNKLCMKMNDNLLHGGIAACVPNKILIRTLTT